MEARKLKANEVELRIGSKSKDKTKAQLLVYKDARTDMALLDEMYGNNWQAVYQDIKGVLYCGIGVKIDNDWVWRWNCGVESKGTGEDDPNNIKGEASDSFKRAGFLWGVGRELYDLKNIWVDNDENNRYQKFFVKTLEWNGNELAELTITNDNDKIAYQFKGGKKAYIPKEPKQADSEIIVNEPVKDVTKQENAVVEPKIDVKPQLDGIVEFVKNKNNEIYKELLKDVFTMLVKAEVADADKKAKQIIVEYFDNSLKIPFKQLSTTVEFTKDTTQDKPTIQGRVLLNKEEVWVGGKDVPSLKQETDMAISIYEMEKDKNNG